MGVTPEEVPAQVINDAKDAFRCSHWLVFDDGREIRCEYTRVRHAEQLKTAANETHWGERRNWRSGETGVLRIFHESAGGNARNDPSDNDKLVPFHDEVRFVGDQPNTAT